MFGETMLMFKLNEKGKRIERKVPVNQYSLYKNTGWEKVDKKPEPSKPEPPKNSSNLDNDKDL